MKKQEFLTALVVACIAVMSLSVLVYAATWTPEQMADWMYRVGKPKIWKILRNTNEMTAKVDNIQEKMGQGLVGETTKGSVDTKLGEEKTMWDYTVPPGNPKKVSLWVDLSGMGTQMIVFSVLYDVNADGNVDMLEDTATRKFILPFDGSQTAPGKLIIDELPVATKLEIHVWQGAGTSFKIDYHVIVEEV